jgi:hypothetical protein
MLMGYLSNTMPDWQVTNQTNLSQAWPYQAKKKRTQAQAQAKVVALPRKTSKDTSH